MKNLDTTIELAESIGQFIEYWGFRSIHGRVWTLVFLAEAPISTPEIVEALGVSKGLISGAINELLDHGLIEQGDKVVHGAQTYVPAAEVGTVVRDILRRRELVLLEQTEAQVERLLTSRASLLKENNIDPEKLVLLKGLVREHRSVLNRLVGKPFRTVQDWTRFVKTAVKVLRF